MKHDRVKPKQVSGIGLIYVILMKGNKRRKDSLQRTATLSGSPFESPEVTRLVILQSDPRLRAEWGNRSTKQLETACF